MMVNLEVGKYYYRDVKGTTEISRIMAHGAENFWEGKAWILHPKGAEETECQFFTGSRVHEELRDLPLPSCDPFAESGATLDINALMDRVKELTDDRNALIEKLEAVALILSVEAFEKEIGWLDRQARNLRDNNPDKAAGIQKGIGAINRLRALASAPRAEWKGEERRKEVKGTGKTYSSLQLEELEQIVDKDNIAAFREWSNTPMTETEKKIIALQDSGSMFTLSRLWGFVGGRESKPAPPENHILEAGEKVGQSIDEFQAEVNEWQDATFQRSVVVAIERMASEAWELREAFEDERPNHEIVDEAVDVALVLMDWCNLSGVKFSDLLRDKFEVCKKRKWAKGDDGVIEHVREPAEN